METHVELPTRPGPHEAGGEDQQSGCVGGEKRTVAGAIVECGEKVAKKCLSCAVGG